MNNKNYGALFDLDGVLIDSESTYTQFWNSIEQDFPTGIPNYAVAIKGTTLEEIMKHYDDERVKAEIMRRLDKFQAEMKFSLFDGVTDFLTDLRRHAIPMAIVTSSDHLKMQRLFDQIPSLRSYFNVVIDASMISRSKPDPEGYLMAARSLGCDPCDCFVFEDSRQGIRAGKASGATVVGLATTLPREVISPEADLVIDDFKGFDVDRLLTIRN